MGSAKKKAAAKSKKAKKNPRKKGIPKAVTPDFSPSATVKALSLTSDACPSRVYDGAVLLNDASLQSFLQTAAGTYLMLLDPTCSGQGTRQQVIDAYNVFSNNPGRNQRLVCQGFLHEYGTTQVLHVVHVVS